MGWNIAWNIPLRRRICCQCLLERVLFNSYTPVADMPVRRLAHMLRLDQAKHQAYSWCCGATANCPMALAAVDPGVVRLDFDCVPPDRFHGVVDMVNDMFDVVRARLEQRHIAQVRVQIGWE